MGKRRSRDPDKGSLSRRRPLLAGLSALAAVSLCPLGAAADQPTEVAGLGHWPLRKLGSDAILIPLDAGTTRAAVRFGLPAKAQQGPDVWYLVRLHALLRIRAGGGPGSIYLSSLVNGAASNQAEVHLQRAPACSTFARWSTVDLLEGYQAHESCGPVLEVDTTNFVQYRGIRPGLNRLSFRLERFGRAEPASVRILADSGISVSRRGPARLTFEPTELARDFRPGARFQLPFVLRNMGDRPARRIVVELGPVGELDALGARRRRYAALAPGSTLEGSFRLRARHVGYHQLSIAAVSTANHPEIALELTVSPRMEDRESEAKRVLSIGGVLAIAIGLIFLFTGRRRIDAEG